MIEAMAYTLLVYLHLMATCVALGTIVLTDLRLLAKVMGYRVVIPRPERLETVIISIALLLLCLTGAAIVFTGFVKNPLYLDNEKLQAKLILVALLAGNAVFLHRRVFPILARSMPVSHWRKKDWMAVAASVSFSNSVWLFCAFLGVARVWNNAVSMEFVLGVAGLAWMVFFAVVNGVLLLASRDAPKEQPDWIDSVKATISDFAELREQPPPIAGKVSDRRRYPRPDVASAQ
jgi:hypothetical protein